MEFITSSNFHFAVSAIFIRVSDIADCLNFTPILASESAIAFAFHSITDFHSFNPIASIFIRFGIHLSESFPAPFFVGE
jgi:hypothetical protein